MSDARTIPCHWLGRQPYGVVWEAMRAWAGGSAPDQWWFLEHDPVYTLGSPVFEHVTVDLGNGETFVIEARNASPENKYIQSATLNGEPLNSPWFPHEAVRGGRLVLEMGPRANTSWGIR